VKAFLLAAGEGRRLRPLTDSVPKCLVPIRGTPLLGIWLHLCEAHGVSEVLVNVHHLPEHVMAFLESWPTRIDVRVVHEPVLLGSAGTVVANRSFVRSEPTFLILYADVLTNADLGAIARFHAARQEVLTIGVVPTEVPKEKGTLLIDSFGRVTAFAEKAAVPLSNMSNAGIYVASQEIFGRMPASVSSTRQVLDFGSDILPGLVPDVAAFPIREPLMDIGTPESYALAQRAWQPI